MTKDEHEIMRDFDGEKYIASYCAKNGCGRIELDHNGEPTCFGCDGLEKRVDAMYQSILKRRLRKLSDCI